MRLVLRPPHSGALDAIDVPLKCLAGQSPPTRLGKGN